MPEPSKGTRRSAASIGVLAAVLAAVLASPILIGPSAMAAEVCPPASAGGTKVASIRVGDVRVPVKEITFEPGGVLEPPPTNRAAGISKRHATLGARRGTSVIAWHKRYGPGCPGTLNPLLKQRVGSTFTVKPVGQAAMTFRITERLRVPKGRYRPAWFDQAGPYRMVLFSCAGFRDGVFTDTVAIFAEPVSSAPAFGEPSG